ncbi:PREDICTED: uncharacterized protein LOC107193879 [Dufourea novaeangliae]|nr:PREDICTED: uncharacterized protein LOC107193879 [Dufourea novaeangliae]
MIHIKLLYPHRGQLSHDTLSDAYDSRRNSIDSNDAKEMKQVVQETKPVPSKETQIVPVKPPRRDRRRVSANMWSSALKNQLDQITNESTDVSGGTTKIMRAQIEVNPSAPSNQEASDSLGYKSLHPGDRISPELVDGQSHTNDERARRLSSAVVKKWKNLKKNLMCSRTKKAMILRDSESDETQRLNLPVPASVQRAPAAQSTMLQKTRLVDVSTSTRISGNIQTDQYSMKQNNNNENNESRMRSSDQANPRPEALDGMVSLIKRRSVNGKSIVDVRIDGLVMNQSELLDLFEVTRSKSRSASIVTTEEASIISIKFHRRRNSTESMHSKDNSFLEDSLVKFQKSILEVFKDLSFSRLFGSREQSRNSNPATPSIQISNYTRMLYGSRNETSYKKYH